MSEPSAFHRLHPTIQQELYRMKWTSLRPIQVDAIHAVLGGAGHLIISAMTAGGKTEAAFLPILSEVAEDYLGSIRALYVGPLKALINDQFRRLEELCEHAEIPVHKWHGDVGQSAKHRVLKSPGGVLLITPESIESLFINHPDKLDTLFARLSFIVIDELHAFLGNERGAHLRSLLARLMQRASYPVRIIGLSATLGDMTSAKRWVDGRTPEDVALITSEGDKTVKYLIKGYRRLPSGEERGEEATDDTEAIATADDFRLAQDLITTFAGTTALIFANSKQQLELYADLSGRILSRDGKPNPFRIHHGSLSKAEREDTEEALRSSRPTATFCSSTLELGIDVGNVCAVGQIGAPWSIASLKQRLGRSGRREGEPSVLWLYVVEDAASEHSRPIDRLYPQLLRAIAMTELMLEGWCEPPDIGHWHLSTLIQQVMSVVTEAGGASAASLYERLIMRGAFENIDQSTFVRTLRSMGSNDLIEQTPEGTIILGLKGERIARSFEFYSAFVTEKELRVLHRGHLIGTVSALPTTGADGYLILAGRRWKILEIDLDREEVLVEPSRGGRLPLFAGASGPDLHPRIHAKMREVLAGASIPIYLDQTAKDMLHEARTFAQESNILQYPFFCDGNETIWFTWSGTRVNRTLLGLGLYHGLSVRDEGVALAFDRLSDADIQARYSLLLLDAPDSVEIAEYFPVKAVEKYDGYVVDELLCEAFARNYLDLPSALQVIESAPSNTMMR
ncbi:MAG: putative ATP-dependent helicase Lhr [bacterium ADurb.Bin429]|nr:MAG: putative ATP-dependent helicase Lhr [bacterium ADurb.Bin429]